MLMVWLAADDDGGGGGCGGDEGDDSDRREKVWGMTGVDGGRPATEPPATFVVGYLVARGTALRLRHWCDACVQFLTTVWQHFFAAERSESRQGEIGTAASLSHLLSLSLCCSSPLRQAHQSPGPVTIRRWTRKGGAPLHDTANTAPPTEQWQRKWQ